MRFRISLALAAVAAVVAACSSDEESSNGQPAPELDAGDAAAEAEASNLLCEDVPSNAAPECDSCRRAACCDEARACMADPECRTWLECEDACDPNDEPCVSACWKGNPAPFTKAAYAACKQRSCAEPCGVKSCTGKSFGYQDHFEGACGECRKKYCCSSFTDCAEDPKCTSLAECFSSCKSTSCYFSKCNNDEYLPLHMEMASDWACRSRYCLAECGSEQDCSTVFSSPTFQDCVHDNCCAESKACSDDAECLQHSICTRNCGSDEVCKTACDSQYWIGGGLDWVMRYCLTRSCNGHFLATAATSTCGGFGGLTASCQTCMDQSCCDEGEACGTDAACSGVHICMDTCVGDAACQAKCLSVGAPEGVAKFQSLTTCRSTKCSAECK